jgi:hypothetical protein
MTSNQVSQLKNALNESLLPRQYEHSVRENGHADQQRIAAPTGDIAYHVSHLNLLTLCSKNTASKRFAAALMMGTQTNISSASQSLLEFSKSLEISGGTRPPAGCRGVDKGRIIRRG